MSIAITNSIINTGGRFRTKSAGCNCPPIKVITKEEYDALENKDPNTLYVISDEQVVLSDYWTAEEIAQYLLNNFYNKGIVDEKFQSYDEQINELKNSNKVFVILTREEYNSLETKDPEKLYIISDEEPMNAANYYTKDEISQSFSEIKNVISDNYYTKDDIDDRLRNNYYTFEEIDAKLSDNYYTKDEIDSILGEINTRLSAI